MTTEQKALTLLIVVHIKQLIIDYVATMLLNIKFYTGSNLKLTQCLPPPPYCQLSDNEPVFCHQTIWLVYSIPLSGLSDTKSKPFEVICAPEIQTTQQQSTLLKQQMFTQLHYGSLLPPPPIYAAWGADKGQQSRKERKTKQTLVPITKSLPSPVFQISCFVLE